MKNQNVILRISLLAIVMLISTLGYAVDRCTKIDLEMVTATGNGPGILLNFKCWWSGAGGATWYDYEGPYTVYRDDVLIATINEGHQYLDLDVRTGSNYYYRVSAHGCSSSINKYLCKRNFEVTISESEVEIQGLGGSAEISVSAVKEEWVSYVDSNHEIRYRIESTSWSWVAASDSDWCAVERNATGTSITLNAPRNPTGNTREAIITISVGGYQRRRIAVTQPALSSDMVYVTTTDGDDIAVPLEWFGRYDDFTSRFGTDLYAALLMHNGKRDENGNALYVWQDYVAGTDPTDTNDVFRARIVFSNGVPFVSWSPNLNTNNEVRVYTVMGKTNLSDEVWQSSTNSTHRFFKVKVGLP